MNYAQIKFPEGERLIHANELAALHDYHEKDIEIHRTKLGVKKILAGTIKLNQHCDLDLESQYYTTSDFAYITGKRCNLFKIIDIRIAENHSFAALVEGEISIHNQPIAAFKRDNELSIRDNIIQRSCLLSFEHEIGQDHVEENDETDLENEWGIRYKDRQEVLDTVFQQENIFTATHYTYHLTHTYDREPRRILLSSTIEPYTMDLLIAYIQFVASDIDMHYSVDQEDVIRVVKDLYSNQAQVNTNVINLDPTPCEIDLHINWEWWCGQYDRIMSHKLFHNDRLQNMLDEIIRKSKERR
ncbi:hypothetical protein ACPV3A_29610 [Paenibacillus sp. Dod16]|uniref:hypothetical protein n=1 Tax=Paenibacillus sp. Dod16 TaxID=3416392 RepID=UPI003CF60638